MEYSMESKGGADVSERKVESWIHRMVRIGRDLKDHLVPTPLP